MDSQARTQIGERPARRVALQVRRGGGARPDEGARGLEAAESGCTAASVAGRHPAQSQQLQPRIPGAEFEWVTLRTLRKAVSTRVYERMQDGDAARRQLGNTKDIARTHYTDMPDIAPDHRSIIEELFGCP
ncbi:hypothetical protein ABZ942_19730 [Nocardia sp. NPDC046473]|uniref:hypothetical protein n=1 Tax=Nocardia sp. NPDC046473 TaxID=3155733 RepID=UPI0033EC9DB2